MSSIGLISDVHATPAPVAEALAIFAREGVDQVFCAGDIAGYGNELEETVALLVESGCRSIVGNHELMYLDHLDDDARDKAAAYFNGLPATIDATIEGKRVYMVHAHPPDANMGGIRLLDRNGKVETEAVSRWAGQLENFDCDVLVVGHTHQVFAERVGRLLIVNPGSTTFNHSCAILRLPEMTVQTYPLSGKVILKSWNWGDHVIEPGL
jgi:putative phosphoesterase